jgi:uncharacterized protein
MKRMLVPAAMILMAVLNAPVAAGPFEDAAAAYTKGDHVTAVWLWLQMANAGNVRAQIMLGTVYFIGAQGVPQNYVRAYMWFKLSAAQGDELGKKSRDLVARRMTPAQIVEAEKLVREWRPVK